MMGLILECLKQILSRKMKGIPQNLMMMMMMSPALLVMLSPVADGYQMHRLWTVSGDCRELPPLEVGVAWNTLVLCLNSSHSPFLLTVAMCVCL